MTLIPLKSAPECHFAILVAALCGSWLLIWPAAQIAYAWLVFALLAMASIEQRRIRRAAVVPDSVCLDSTGTVVLTTGNEQRSASLSPASCAFQPFAVLFCVDATGLRTTVWITRRHNRRDWSCFQVLWQWGNRDRYPHDQLDLQDDRSRKTP
ncbi:MAG: hypothetical protein AAF290_04230 [Pseudomonadota bacterium]